MTPIARKIQPTIEQAAVRTSPSGTIAIWARPCAMRMLVDTGAGYALADTSDRSHAEASRFYSEHAGRTPFVTTELIVAETCTLLTSHLSRSAALTFWETLRVTRLPILILEPVDLEAAWHIAQAFPDQAFSCVDCTTFALMERLGMTEAFAFDAHFLVYRFGRGRQRAFRRFPREQASPQHVEERRHRPRAAYPACGARQWHLDVCSPAHASEDA